MFYHWPFFRVRMKVLTIVTSLLVIYAVVAAKNYGGYKLIRVVPTTDAQVEQLSLLHDTNVELDFWSDPFKGRPTDINVPPTEYRNVYKKMRKLKLQIKVIQNDVQQLIDTTNKASTMKIDLLSALAAKGVYHPKAAKFIEKGKGGPQWFRKALDEIKAEMAGRPNITQMAQSTFDIVGRFPRYDEILDWLDSRVDTFPDIASVESIGNTYENREMRIIKIGSGAGRNTNKPIIWVDSAIHAREWLTVGTTIWIINMMLSSYNTDADVRQALDTYDWYFLPVSNPDGYEYTHTSDRLWRKTRSRGSSPFCRGTDPNRNFDAHWMESGTSTNPCSDTYGGPSAFSEECTKNMRDAIARVSGRMKLYMGVHSYSQMWLMPWAWGGSKPSDYNELLAVANAGNSALRSVHGTRFQVGTPPDILYSAAGGAYDWVKEKQNVKYSYTFELRPDGNAYNGFVVSEDQIQPSGEEVWAALNECSKQIR